MSDQSRSVLPWLQYIIVKNIQCALCKETKTESFRTINETTKGKAGGRGYNNVVVAKLIVLYCIIYLFTYIYFLLLDK